MMAQKLAKAEFILSGSSNWILVLKSTFRSKTRGLQLHLSLTKNDSALEEKGE